MICGSGLFSVGVILLLVLRRRKLSVQRADHFLRQQNAYVKHADRKLSEARKLHHDMDHVLLVLNNCMESGQWEEAKDYLAQLSGMEMVGANRVNSGFSAVDAVMNAKISQAEALGVTIRHQMVKTGPLLMDELRLAVVLANLLDNAIEASVRVSGEERRAVQMEIRVDREFIRIRVSNGMKPEKLDVGMLRTSKKDRSRHGWGLKSIAGEVSRHDGAIRIRARNHRFTVHILMRNQLA